MAEEVKKEQGATGGTEEKKTAGKTTKKEQGATGGKVYRFKSANKFLSCVGLGVQFIDGKATTDKLEVARELVKLDGVEMIES